MSRRRHRSARELVAEELEILPMMNLFVVLIPMLLLSAVFLEMSVIRMSVPADDAAEPPKQSLGLSVAIQDESWIVKARRIDTVVIDRAAADADEQLRGTLAGLSSRFPDAHDVVIRNGARTRYEDIVAVMDASRESGFPNVSLAGVEQ